MKTRNPVLKAVALALGLASTVSAYGAATFDPLQQPFGDVPRLAVTGFNISGGTQKAFQVWFDGYNWVGDLAAYPVSVTGTTSVTERLWSARDVFDTKQACGNSSPSDKPGSSTTWYDLGRIIVTKNASNVSKPFRWASLSAAQQSSIGDSTKGPKILNYVRGDRSNEKLLTIKDGTGTVVQFQCGISTGTLRGRLNILGDIVHSAPVYVGAPKANYQFDSYQTFKTNNASRAPRVYVGANDGMVHSFDAATGAEVFAYIPSMLISKLKTLSVDPYVHNLFVDGTLTVGDVNFGTTAAPDWRTILVGGLGGGGKGLFALDITDPTATNETFAAAKILWEITPASSGYNDLGNTYGDPLIVRLNTGQWAAIVGNGYNSTATGRAWLYIIDIKTGAVIKALDTGSGTTASPNGLSSPAAIDTNGDGKVDVVYAGDIDGHLWKFDISASNAGSWTNPTAPLFPTSADTSAGVTLKAIVGAPDVAFHPLSGYLVYFATGRLFTPADACDKTVQNYAYGVWDGAPVANTKLLDQTLEEKSYNGLIRTRVSSSLAINWNDASDPTNKPLHHGWRTALPAGERVLGTGFISDGRYQFISVDPNVVNDPKPNGANWLSELDYLTGGANKLIFDLSADGELTEADRISDSGGPVGGAAGIPVAVYEGKGLLSQPVLVILSAQLATTIFNNNPYFDPASNIDCATLTQNPPSNDPGVSGGHFDVDIYYGSTDSHTHEYDDKYDVTGVNFLNASDPAKNIQNAIPGMGTKFKILVANQTLSPAVSFSYGGRAYQNVALMNPWKNAGLLMADQPTYSRLDIATLKFKMPADAFKVKDWILDGNKRVGLQPTQTGCVKGPAPSTLGPNGEYRNGALVFQLVKDTTPDSAVQLSQPGDPRYGYRLTMAAYSTYLLAEWSVFWHHPNGKCMGTTGWTDEPPMDTSSSTARRTTPAAGSQDPPYDEGFGTVISTEVTVAINTDTSIAAKTVRTTTTTYSTGAQVIVKEYLDGKGKVIKTVVTVVPAPPSGTSDEPPPESTTGILATPNTVTGYQQSRFKGKAGRVTWHEMFAQ